MCLLTEYWKLNGLITMPNPNLSTVVVTVVVAPPTLPNSFALQQRSISSMWAKNLSSSPPSSLYSEDLIIIAAPEAQNISMLLSYCPLSSSMLDKILPLQKG